MAKRFYQIAFELSVRPRTFMRALSEMGLSVGNQMVVVQDELETRIREMYRQMTAPKVVEAPPAEVETATDGEGAPLVAEGAAPEAGEATTEQAPPAKEAAPPEPLGAPAKLDESSRGRRVDDGRRTGELLPTLDPRAGRLVKAAPAGGVPMTSRTKPDRAAPGTRSPGFPATTQPSDRAPGNRRDSGRRQPTRYQGGRRGSGKETFAFRRRGRRRKGPAAPKVRPTEIEVELPITVKGFGELSSYKAAEIIKVLFQGHKLMLTPNSKLDRETCEILSIELEVDVNFKLVKTSEDELLERLGTADEAGELKTRPPIVTILGHVDHGKTTLLDKIRATDTAGREAGGITQHIGASQVTLEDGRRVTFIDTPGHAAFTEMRARGAQVTDVVVLVVAVDDGVMPQTVEAISHAKAAKVPIVVAATKIDKEGGKIERLKQQLTEHDVFVDGYGGDVALFGVSGITGEGVKELLEHLALMAEVDPEHFQANPDRAAVGTVIESQNSPKRGILATVLIERGTLNKKDTVLVGDAWGSVRAMFNDKGEMLKSAGPGDPVEITGLDRAPEAGSKLHETENVGLAKEIATARRTSDREKVMTARMKPATIDALFGAIEEKRTESVNLVVKADVMGSLAPLKRVLNDMSIDEVRVTIVHAGVGAVNDSDVVLASASKAAIIAFHVNTDAKARTRAKREHVDIRPYKVIYDIEDDVADMLEGRLAPDMQEKILGHAEILAIFTFSKVGNIAGCRVKDGLLRRDALVRVFRGEEMIHEGQLSTLRREKDDAKEVKEGFECGLTVKGFDTIEVGDRVEAYVLEAKKRKLVRNK